MSGLPPPDLHRPVPPARDTQQIVITLLVGILLALLAVAGLLALWMLGVFAPDVTVTVD